MTSALISESYRALNAALHQSGTGYGSAGHAWAQIVGGLIGQSGARSVLDYGCGTGSLIEHLQQALPTGIAYAGYDPAVERFSAPPEPADFVICTDVLEHIEPDLLDGVLDHLQSLTKVAAFFVISTRPARRILPDGRNAHLIQQPYFWWMPKLWDRFDIRQFRQHSNMEPDDELIFTLKVRKP